MSVSLNAAQREAVEYEAGPLAVLAGPGTGKTRVIVHRVAHMIGHRGIAPERICALTFTNKAAEEMRQRLGDLVGGAAADAVHAGTFHSFGLRLLRRFADLADLPPMPKIMDSSQQRRLIRSLVLEHRLFAHAMGGGLDSIVRDALSAISDMRDAGLEPSEARGRLEQLLGDDSLEPGPRAELERFADHVRLFELFDLACAKRGLLAIDELITRPTRLLTGHALVRDICRHDYAHVVVDEFQDLNAAQIRLLIALGGPGRPDLCVVGDDDQAIYAFRGADEYAFVRFQEAWPQAHRVLLTENWRSGVAVIDCANAIIGASTTRFAPDKVVAPPKERAGLPSCVEVVAYQDEPQGEETIAAMILLDRQACPDRAWSDYAVLARTNSEVERIAGALELESIPVLVLRSPDATEDEGVQDLLAWISLVLEPEQTWAARRLLSRPPYGVDPLRLGRCERAWQAEASRLGEGQHMPPIVEWMCERYADEVSIAPHAQRVRDLARTFAASASSESADRTVQRIIIEGGLVHADLPGGRIRALRVESLVAVLRFVRERLDRLEQPHDLAAFWRYYNDLDPKEQGFTSLLDASVSGPESEGLGDAGGVRVFTAHASKGLEFDTVFLPRCYPPHGYPKTMRQDAPVTPEAIVSDRPPPPPIEEERRVFYVACTRAMRRLVLLGKVPKKPGPTNLVFPLISAGLCVRQEAADILAQAAEEGLGRFARAAERSELDRGLSVSRREVLARARQRVRLEASLALDAADRADVSAEEVARVARRLDDAARMLACVASLEGHQTPPPEVLAGHLAFAEQLRAELNGLPREVDGEFFRAPRPPLHLSFTTINAYLRCPRCYYVTHVLHLPEPIEAPVRVGSVVHAALEQFYRRWRDAESEGRPTPGLDALLALGREAFAGAHDPDEPLDAGERLQVLAQLQTVFERLHDAGAEPLELEKKIDFDYEHNGIRHRMVAKIDRIDRGPAGLRIIDYKTGGASKKLLEPESDDLQLGLYAMALEHLYGAEGLSGTAEYWLTAQGQVGLLRLSELDRVAVREQIDKAIDGILGGNFERDARGCNGVCAILDAVSRGD